jgi:single-strand DNA-binding protein
VFFKKLADTAGDLLKKGSKIYVEGALRTQQWDKNGEKRYRTEVVVHELQLLDRPTVPSSANGSSSNPASEGADWDDEYADMPLN